MFRGTRPGEARLKSCLKSFLEMKILLIPAKYLPAIGGLEFAVQSMARELKRRGHSIHILTNRYALNLKSKEVVDGIRVERLFFTDTPPRSRSLWTGFKYAIRLMIAPWSFFRLWRLLQKEKFDIVHTHFVASSSRYLLLCRKILKFKWVVSLHGSDVHGHKTKSQYRQNLLRETLNEADYVTANTDYLMGQVLSETGCRSLEGRSEVVPMGFTPNDGTVPLKKVEGPFLFSAGRFVRVKGFDVLIKAYAQILTSGNYKGRLILAGGGEEWETCKKLAEELGVERQIDFLGFLSPAEISAYMKRCDVFIMPSRFEAFGITLLEALDAGGKVVASKVGGMVELMRDNPDYLVEPDQPEALVEKILWALKDSSWRRIPKEVLRENYSWTRVTDSYLSIYQRLDSRTR